MKLSLNRCPETFRPVIALILFGVSLAMLPAQAKAATATLKLSPAATHVPVKQTEVVTDLFTISTGGSFAGSVTLSVSGLPSSVTGKWSSNVVTPKDGVATSTLTLEPNATASPNWYVFTVTASGDGISVSDEYTVEVKPLVGMEVLLSGPALTVDNNAAAALTVTAKPQNGVTILGGATGATATITSALPSGVTASWSSPVLESNGSVNWTLTMDATRAAGIGKYPIALLVKITDADGGLTYGEAPTFPLLVSLLAEANVGNTPGVTIPANFLGLSHEMTEAQGAIIGSSAIGINYLYRQMLANLTAHGSDPINIRIGGDGTDTSGEPTSTSALAFAELATATGSHFSMGVNLGENNPALAAAQAAAYIKQMPSGYLDALEVGNEPDLYIKNGYRPSTYTTEDYFSDFNTWKAAIDPLLPSKTKLMGASWGYYTTMQASGAAYEDLDASSLALYSQHAYAASPLDLPTAAWLLSPVASTQVPAAVADGVAMTHAHGIPFRMGEFGSISDAGVLGVSDSFASALWAMDVSFEFANEGVDGVNWLTTVGNPDSPFKFNVEYSGGSNHYSINAIRPIYYGLYLFQMALGSGAEMLPVSLSTPANLKAWATVPTGRTPRVMIINKDLTQSGTVEINMPGYSQAQIISLTAPSYLSTRGVVLSGQTFDGSTDGTLQGTKTVDTINGENGTFRFPMAITSAALVIFQD